MSITFTKLFSSITESTIWVEPYATRIVWVSMLAMADRKGRIWASIPGLARRAGVTLEECETALGRFQSPDKYSRTPDNEGRRIQPIDGGWELLNYEKYRAIRDDEARREYQREWDRTHRSPTKSDTSDKIRPPPTKAEAEAEAEADTKPNCTVPLPRDGLQGVKAERHKQARELLEFLNAKAGRFFRPVPANLRFIEARLAEGVTVQDLKTLTVRKCRDWLGSDMAKFLRPETLFNATKCQQYLGEIPPEVPCSAPNATALSPPVTPPAPAVGSSPSDSIPADRSRARDMAGALGRTLVAAGASTREH